MKKFSTVTLFLIGMGVFAAFAWNFTHGAKFTGLLYLAVSFWWWTAGVVSAMGKVK